jgi:hypothetical protein
MEIENGKFVLRTLPSSHSRRALFARRYANLALEVVARTARTILVMATAVFGTTMLWYDPLHVPWLIVMAGLVIMLAFVHKMCHTVKRNRMF